LLQAGMPLVDAVRSLALQEKQQTTYISQQNSERLFAITRLVRAGRPLATALRLYDEWLSEHVIATIAAAQGTAQLPEVLQELARMLELHDTQWRALRHAVAMPVLTLGAALVVSGVAVVVVVPTLLSMVSDSGTLPGQTQQLLLCIEWLRLYGAFTLVAAVLVAAGVWKSAEYFEKSHVWRDRLLYYLPLGGPLLRQLHSTQWLRRISVQLRAGVPLLQSLEAALALTTNKYARLWQSQLCAAVRGGMPFVAACARVPQRCMPTGVASLIGLAPHNKALAGIAEQAAQLVAQRMQHTTALLLRLAQPVALCVVGGVVFVVIRALYAPLMHVFSSLAI
jgi:type IV pilus assembly protein PilC